MLETTKICKDLKALHPYVEARALLVLEMCKERNLSVDVFETLRFKERQKMLFETKKSKTLESYHELGLAVDFVFKTRTGQWTWDVPKEKWDELSSIMEECGFSSLWKRSGWDGPHAEITFKDYSAKKLHQEKAKYKTMTEWFSFLDKLIAEDPKHGPSVKPPVIVAAKSVSRELLENPIQPTPLVLSPIEKQTSVIKKKSFLEKLLASFRN